MALAVLGRRAAPWQRLGAGAAHPLPQEHHPQQQPRKEMLALWPPMVGPLVAPWQPPPWGPEQEDAAVCCHLPLLGSCCLNPRCSRTVAVAPLGRAPQAQPSWMWRQQQQQQQGLRGAARPLRHVPQVSRSAAASTALPPPPPPQQTLQCRSRALSCSSRARRCCAALFPAGGWSQLAPPVMVALLLLLAAVAPGVCPSPPPAAAAHHHPCRCRLLRCWGRL